MHARALTHATTAIHGDGMVDLHVVKVWPQAGIGVYRSDARDVAELLLKDDGVALHDAWRPGCGHWRHAYRRQAFYHPPEVRLDGDVRTTFGAAQSKQLLLSVRIPPSADAGTYHGRVEVQRGQEEVHYLAVEIEVLPLRLVAPTQHLFLWYRATLDCRRPRNHVSATLMAHQLRDIRAHGFTSVSLSEDDPTLLQQAVDIAYDAGFRRNLILCAPFPPAAQRIDFRGLTPIYFISDEADHRGEPAVRQHVANWRLARERGVPTMCSLTQEAFARRFRDDGDLGHEPDTILYYLPRNLDFIAARSLFPTMQERPVYYYWHSHMEKPLLHRVLAGAYLWKSGADGIAPYCYQDLPEPPHSPYDDFDEWDQLERQFSAGHPLRDHMTTYPARSGSIPTLQWKGLSAGISDLTYLTTLAALVERGRAAGGAAAAAAREVWARVDQFLERIPLRQIEIASDTEARPYPTLEAASLDAFREEMARDALALEQLLSA